MTLTDFMCQEKKEDDDLPALKITLTHRYNDNKDYIEKRREDWLQPPETILTTRRPRERQWSEIKNGKKNNSMDVLSGKQATSHRKKRGRG